MKFRIGQVVRSTAGRDRNHVYIVVDILPQRVLVADGRRRKAVNPKPKNPLHLSSVTQPTPTADTAQFTDDDIRQILRKINAEKLSTREIREGLD